MSKTNVRTEITIPDDYIVFDLETTGFSVRYAEIIEIGAVKVENRKITDTFHTYVRPIRGIPGEITELTGITERMTSKAPYIDEAASDFLSFIEDETLIAHNAPFDMRFMGTVCLFFGYDFRNPAIDSVKIAKAYMKAENYKLETLKRTLGIDLPSHNALDDCRVTYSVVEHCRLLGERK